MQELYWSVVELGRDILPRDFTERHPKSVKISPPESRRGDGVLISKLAYGHEATSQPDRLDLIAFRYAPDTRMVYLKRLVGLPGETIAIHGGKLYRLPSGTTIHYPKPEVSGEPDSNEDSIRSWGIANMHENFSDAVEQFRRGRFEIIRKKPAQVLALRRIVY